jgi:hypothetical protein
MAVSTSPIVLNVAQVVPVWTSSTIVRRSIALERRVSGSLCAAPRPPRAVRSLAVYGPCGRETGAHEDRTSSAERRTGRAGRREQ